MSEMDQTFRTFVANQIDVNLDDIIYVSPTPMYRDGILYVAFIVRRSSRRKRDEDGGMFSTLLCIPQSIVEIEHFKGIQHLKPKLSMLCGLSRNDQHLVLKFNIRIMTHIV